MSLKAINTIECSPREDFKKGAGKAIRKNHLVPLNLYMKDATSLHLSTDHDFLNKLTDDVSFKTRIFSIKIGNKKINAIAQNILFSPNYKQVLEAEFVEILEDKKITYIVPIQILNKDTSPVIKRGGKFFQHFYSAKLKCFPKDIVEKLVIDLGEESNGKKIWLKDITPSENIQVVNNIVVATLKASGKDGGAEEAAK